MTARQRLVNRRQAETFNVECAGLLYVCTIGRFPNGSVAEVFLSNGKCNSAADTGARDSGILVSLCLQHGCSVETIARALSRNSDGSASGVIGAVLDKVIAGEPR